jgi:hypothetical protein
MNKKSFFLFFLCALFYGKHSLAQVSVNPLTGAAQVNIPLYTLRSGQVALPVSLSYNNSGVKPKDVEGTAGMGWQINTGGQISRVVHGLPDDVTKDNANNQRLGWMSSLDTAANKIATFSIANNGSTCSNETTDITYINANFPFRNDTEPDIFYVGVPGLSCQMIYDRTSGAFKAIGDQDLVISYGTDPTSHLITAFTITNDKGIIYTFGNYSDLTPAYNKVTQTAKNVATVAYYKNVYQQYQNGITYYDTWGLTSITDVNGNGVQLNYSTPLPSKASSDSLVLYLPGSSVGSTQYRMVRSNTPYNIQSVQTYNAYSYSSSYLSFTWATPTSSTGQSVISSVKLTNGTTTARNFQFTYSLVASPGGFARYFLRNFSDPGCSTPVSYQFAYVGETNTAGTYTTTLPDSTKNTYDYWGYYSTSPGSSTVRIPTVYINMSSTTYPVYSVATTDSYYTTTLTNTSRTVDAANIAVGSLNKITTVQGGNTNIVYEPNDFYNVPSGTVVKGGGIRVKQVIDSVGVHTTNNIIRNYSYLNPSNGLSSGKPISLPQYAFAIPGATGTGSTLYTNATVLSSHDLSGEDNTVMYAYFKVSQAGAGMTVSQFYIPATYWDVSATPACSGCTTPDWVPTINYLGRQQCAGSYAPMSNDTYVYPFLPNPNYDFERGLPIRVTSYADNGTTEVSESNYTYQRSYTPTAITAFKYENNSSASGNTIATNYNKYTVYYKTSELTTKVVNKVYDAQGAGQIHADSAMYTYGSANHKLMTQQQSTNSDGSTVTTKLSYVKDYTLASGTNANVTALYNLKQQNINIPVESYQQVTRAGVTKTTSASLAMFKGYTPGSTTLYLPYRQYKLTQPDGMTGFAPMTISGQVLTFDSTHYVRMANFDTYDKTGYPLTVDDNFKRIGTTIFNHFANQPEAIFSNAAYGEIAFADFDSDITNPPYGFTISGSGSFTPVGSHAGKAAGLASTQTATTTSSLTKNAIATNYIFSIWINAATAGTLTLTLTGISTHPTISYTTGGWKYYELNIPVGTLSSSYSVSFTASNNISIDDILFYPGVSQATTANYDAVSYYNNCATNTNGISTYYVNDNWGRNLLTMDQDHNIVQKNTFMTAVDATTFSSPSILAPSPVYNGLPQTYAITGPDPCAAVGTTVQWNFGDGTIVSAPGLTSPAHGYHSLGAGKTITATITSPFFGIKTVTKPVTPVNYSIPISYTNYTTSGGNITSVVFTPVGGGTTYTFSGSTLNGGHVPQGNYTISVVLAGGQQYNPGAGVGYSCVFIAVDNNNNHAAVCSNWTASNSYTFPLDVTNNYALNFTVSQFDCSHF